MVRRRRCSKWSLFSLLSVGIVVISGLDFSACSSNSDGLPGSLFGTWNGGNNVVHSVRFSDGGRLEINGGSCSGDYQLGAVDGNVGTVTSGYIDCGHLMNGYLTDTVNVSGNSLTLTGDVINGTYQRG